MTKKVIIAYDVKDEKRRNSIRKLLKQYLFRKQYSVFIGELTQKHITQLKKELRARIDEEEDSVIFFVVLNMAYVEMDELGVKDEFDFII